MILEEEEQEREQEQEAEAEAESEEQHEEQEQEEQKQEEQEEQEEHEMQEAQEVQEHEQEQQPMESEDALGNTKIMVPCVQQSLPQSPPRLHQCSTSVLSQRPLTDPRPPRLWLHLCSLNRHGNFLWNLYTSTN